MIIITANGKEILVDEKDYSMLIQHKWFVGTNGYAATGIYEPLSKKTKIMLMHRMIMQNELKQAELASVKVEVHHKNSNKYDNRRCNLMVVTQGQNNSYRPAYNTPTKSSVYKWVYWRDDRKMWLVRINKEGHNYHVGYFTDEREAALAGNIKATTLFGEHVELNQLKLSEEQISIIKAKWDLKKQSPIKFRQPRRAKSSKYKGVHYDSERKQWIASITGKTGKTVFVGRYKTEQEAALAYNAKAAELFGEYASLNK